MKAVDAIAAVIKDLQDKTASTLRAVVTVVEGKGLVTIHLGDPEHPLEHVPCLTSYSPRKGDVVSVQQSGDQLIVLGPLGEYRSPVNVSTEEPNPEDASPGDIWIDPDKGDLRIYNPEVGYWSDFHDKVTEEVKNAVAETKKTADGKNAVYHQDEPPVGAGIPAVEYVPPVLEDNGTVITPAVEAVPEQPPLSKGDTWFDTNDGNKVHIWDGTQWLEAQDALIQLAWTTSLSAAVSANGKNTVYRQTSMPDEPRGMAFETGDIWFDIDDGNHVYTYVGAPTYEWVDSQDAAIQSLQTAVALVQETGGGNFTTVSSTTPTGTAKTGDVWLNPVSGTMKTWNGSAWVDYQVGAASLMNEAITTAKLAPKAVTTATLADGSINALQIGNNAVTSTKILDGAITTDKVLANAITGNKIAGGEITGGHIAGQTITAGKLVSGTITAASGVIASIDANVITSGTISSSVIATSSLTSAYITAGRISSGTLATDVLYSGTIAANKITTGTLATDVIYTGSISAASITTGIMTGVQIGLNQPGSVWSDAQLRSNLATQAGTVLVVKAANTGWPVMLVYGASGSGKTVGTFQVNTDGSISVSGGPSEFHSISGYAAPLAITSAATVSGNFTTTNAYITNLQGGVTVAGGLTVTTSGGTFNGDMFFTAWYDGGASNGMRSVNVKNYKNSQMTTPAIMYCDLGNSGQNNSRFGCAASSSKRYKYDIQPLSLDPTPLLDVPVVEFKYRENDARGMGFIAEDIQEAWEYGCVTNEDGSAEMWSEHNMIPALLKLIQDQHRRIQALENN